ncbi:MAG: TatD family hydrolase [Planctomycetota bacterium]
MPEFIDTHAHTGFDGFDPDRPEVYRRAREAGVSAVVEVGVGLQGSRRAVELARQEPLLRPAAGIHPSEAGALDRDWDAFEELVRTDGVVAVGECGLDFYRDGAPPALQEEAFRRPVDRARRGGVPDILHCRAAETDVIRVLTDEAYPRGVVHCFGGTVAQAEEILALGLRLSFCGNVTYKKSDSLREAARAVPLDRLLLETDAPFLPPQARRGRRNEPAFVALTAEFVAGLHGVELDELARQTTANARALFGIEG